jgi:hypothetical protein
MENQNEKNKRAFRDMAHGFVFLSLLDEKISMNDGEYLALAEHYLEATGNEYDSGKALEVSSFIRKETSTARKYASLNTMAAMSDFLKSGTNMPKDSDVLLQLIDNIVTAMENRDTYSFGVVVPHLMQLFGVDKEDVMVFQPIGNSYKLSKVLQDFFKVIELAAAVKQGLDVSDYVSDDDVLSQSMFNKLGDGSGTPPAQA